MKKYKNKIITGIIIVVILSVAFWFGGNAPGLQENKVSSVNDVTVTEEIVKEEVSNLEKNEPEQTEEIKPLEEVKPIETEENEEYSEEMGMVINEDTRTDKYKTEPVPKGMPVPVEPETVSITDKELTCTLSVRCDTILNNLDWFDKEKIDILPDNGIILEEKTVAFYEGESVFNLLLREMKRNKIHMEFKNTPIYNSAYIEGISNIYEFDCGELSGWMYKVNGWFPNYGCSRYQLKEGDRVEWVYTCDLGNDIGGGYSAGNGIRNERI